MSVIIKILLLTILIPLYMIRCMFWFVVFIINLIV